MTARIAVDLLGGDNPPAAVVDGALAASRSDVALAVLLVGPRRLTAGAIEACPPDVHARLSAVDADDAIGMADPPVHTVRNRPGASIRIALDMVRDGAADAVFTVGPTGAAVAAAIATLGRSPGVRRPALAATVPTVAGPVVLLDVGATADPHDGDLVTYALLGAAYARLSGLPAPRVGLLSTGSEPGKGDRRRRRVAAALADHAGYVGLVEGHDVPLGGRADVVVTDGFTGNILLKGLEGAAALAGGRRPDATPAAQLLGVAGTVVLGHGAAGAVEVAQGIGLAADAVRAATSDRLAVFTEVAE